jgi:hypothetical protein
VRAWLWRQKVGAFAQQLGAKNMEDLVRICGSHWAFHLQSKIQGINDLWDYPTMVHAKADGWVEEGTYGESLFQIKVGGEDVLVEPEHLPTETEICSAKELANAIIALKPAGDWKKWLDFERQVEKNRERKQKWGTPAAGVGWRSPYSSCFEPKFRYT